MKKNVDQMTADLYNATKAAYFKHIPGIIRNNADGRPVSVDMMDKIINGKPIDGITIAEETETNQIIDIMPGYSCGLSSLPRIYKQVSRLAGETCEKITIGGAILNAYGFTDEQLKAKENKKILAVLKKYCPAPKKNDSREIQPFKMGVYHDSRRRCAVWTDAHILIVAPWLYNDAAAGHIVAADGTKITDYEGQPAKYPDWSKVVPDMSYETAKTKQFKVYSVPAAAVAANAASVAAAVKGARMAKDYFIAARYTSDGGIVAFNHSFAPWFALVDGDLYFKNANTAAVGYIQAATCNGFIIFMPIMLKDDEISQHADNKTIYADTENDIYIKNKLPQAAADSLPLPFLAVCPEVSTPAEFVADAAADVVADVVEAPAADAATVTDADAEKVTQVIELPAVTVTAATVTDADVLAQAARIKAIYEDIKADAVEDAAPAAELPAPPAVVYVSEPYPPTPNDTDEQAAATVTDADDMPDNTPIYTAAEVAAMVSAAVAEERARYTRRRFAPRLRPVLRRLGRVAAVVLPLLIVAMFTGSSNASTPAADASAVADAAAETVAQVIELPAVTVTASSLTTAFAAPSLVKKLATPSPVKKAADDAATLPSQKTADDIATTTTPAGDDADSITTAPPAPLAPPADTDGLTICAGTAWAYTMMNWS